MNGLFSSAVEIQDFCREREWRYCLIGGVAVQRWGEPRQTRDVDLTLLAGFGSEESMVTELLGDFSGRFPETLAFALENRVVLLRASTGVGIDIALGALPFEERAVSRASDWTVDDVVLHTCSAEDLVVHKAFAGRPQDWIDIEMIVARQAGALEIGVVLDEALPLLDLKETPEDGDRLKSLLGPRPSR